MNDELFDLTDIPGLGEARVNQLYEELGITTKQELLEAINSGEVEQLSGFGPATVQRIKESVERILEEKASEAEEEVLEEDVEEVEEEEVVEEDSYEEAEEEEPQSRPILVDNRHVDRLFSDASARGQNLHDNILVTADKHYVRENRINFLFALVMQMAKVGAKVRFPENYFERFPNAELKDGYWVIIKGE